MRYVEKYGTARQATGDNKIRRIRFSYWIIKATHTHTLRICNTYCFSPTTIVAPMRLNIMYVQFLSCSYSVRVYWKTSRNEARKKTQQQLAVKCQFPRLLRRTLCEDSAGFVDQTMQASVSPQPLTTQFGNPNLSFLTLT
jgi:hypothetical protein